MKALRMSMVKVFLSLSEVSEEAPAAADEEMEIDQQVRNFEEELNLMVDAPGSEDEVEDEEEETEDEEEDEAEETVDPSEEQRKKQALKERKKEDIKDAVAKQEQQVKDIAKANSS